MKPIRRDLSSEFKSIELIPFADWHLGDLNCDFKLIQKQIEYVQNTPNAFCILNGDIMDTAIASSIGDTYAASINPMEQLKQCEAIFLPIKEKILCITGGNHERRVYKSDGIDITYLLAKQLGLAEYYSETTVLMFLRFGKQSKKFSERKVCYSAYITHGSGGGRKEGGKINRLADLASIVDADIYVHSHTHLGVIFREAFFRTDATNNSVQLVDKLFVNTASNLDYGGYGSIQGFKPSSKKSPVIYLSGTRKFMEATL